MLIKQNIKFIILILLSALLVDWLIIYLINDVKLEPTNPKLLARIIKSKIRKKEYKSLSNLIIHPNYFMNCDSVQILQKKNQILKRLKISSDNDCFSWSKKMNTKIYDFYPKSYKDNYPIKPQKIICFSQEKEENNGIFINKYSVNNNFYIAKHKLNWYIIPDVKESVYLKKNNTQDISDTLLCDLKNKIKTKIKKNLDKYHIKNMSIENRCNDANYLSEIICILYNHDKAFLIRNGFKLILKDTKIVKPGFLINITSAKYIYFFVVNIEHKIYMILPDNTMQSTYVEGESIKEISERLKNLFKDAESIQFYSKE